MQGTHLTPTGGGYAAGDPVAYTTFLMCIAETIIASGSTVSVFALDYSYSPEFVFPRQLEEAVAGYEYLVNEVGIPSAKIAFLGDSAGGSILLSLLTHMQVPLPSIPAVSRNIEKPGKGIFLISPWISLWLERGYEERKHSDIISPGSLRTWASGLVHESPQAGNAATYLEFVTPSPERGSMAAILPDRVWVSAGEDELFLDNILGFVQQLTVEGARVEIRVEKGQPHDWQFFQANENEKKFLGQEFGTPSLEILPGAVEIGRAIVGKDM